jgi:hypothetical protein
MELFPVVPTAQWAATYRLSTKEVICEGCNRKVLLNRPWATAAWRGFAVELHECENPTQKFTGIILDDNGDNLLLKRMPDILEMLKS